MKRCPECNDTFCDELCYCRNDECGNMSTIIKKIHNMSIGEQFNTMAKVYEEESEALSLAQKNPQTINYIVGKIMVASRGEIDPELAMKVTKIIVESSLPNNNKMVISND